MRSKVHLLALALAGVLGCAHLPAVVDTLGRLYDGPIGRIVRQCVAGALADEEIGTCLLGPETWSEPPAPDVRARVGVLGRAWSDAYHEAEALAEQDPDSWEARRAARRVEQLDAALAEEIGR